MLILIMVFILISNVYYILTNQQQLFEGVGVYRWEMALFQAYLISLGEAGLDDLETEHEHILFFRIFLTIATFFVIIVMLNLLIAIMGDTFDRVLEQKKEQALREICSFIESYIFTSPSIEREFC